MLSPAEFIKLVILCLLDTNFCLNLQDCTEILATVSEGGTQTASTDRKKSLKVTLFVSNLSFLSSIPALWIRDCF